MAEKNFLNGVVSKINTLPEAVRSQALSLVFGRAVRFAGTASVKIEHLSEYESVLTLKNRKKVQNHIGSVHAAAMALLAESATGFLVGMSVPDSRVPVIKSMHVDYVKRASGDMKAVARLTEEQVELIRTTEKGEVSVEITVTDSKGIEPIKCEFIWAWTEKVRKD